MKKKIAITGGIGSGKSTVLKEIEAMGYPVFSCDEIYREIIAFSVYVEQVKKFFPECVFGGEIDKKRLSAIVFQNEEKRLLLNSIAHPLIMQRLEERMNKATSDLVFAEVPLLFECGYEKQFDFVIVVMREKEKRIQCLLKRDGITKEEVEARISAQFDYHSQEAKIHYATCDAIILQNNGTETELKRQIQSIVKRFS